MQVQFKYLGYSSTPYTKQSILQIRNFRSDVTIYVKQPSGGVISKLTSWSVMQWQLARGLMQLCWISAAISNPTS